jgi:hypothetical protein
MTRFAWLYASGFVLVALSAVGAVELLYRSWP